MSHKDGDRLLARTIRYIEDRRAEESRFTGAIEKHPSPLGVVWGALDPVAVYPMTDKLLDTRPDARRITLEDVGHFPMLEDPQRTADAIVSLLSS
jgi:pimeloyl-ACP methyl ester carboxylesterase